MGKKLTIFLPPTGNKLVIYFKSLNHCFLKKFNNHKIVFDNVHFQVQLTPECTMKQFLATFFKNEQVN